MLEGKWLIVDFVVCLGWECFASAELMPSIPQLLNTFVYPSYEQSIVKLESSCFLCKLSMTNKVRATSETGGSLVLVYILITKTNSNVWWGRCIELSLVMRLVRLAHHVMCGMRFRAHNLAGSRDHCFLSSPCTRALGSSC